MKEKNILFSYSESVSSPTGQPVPEIVLNDKSDEGLMSKVVSCISPYMSSYFFKDLVELESQHAEQIEYIKIKEIKDKEDEMSADEILAELWSE